MPKMLHLAQEMTFDVNYVDIFLSQFWLAWQNLLLLRKRRFWSIFQNCLRSHCAMLTSKNLHKTKNGARQNFIYPNGKISPNLVTLEARPLASQIAAKRVLRLGIRSTYFWRHRANKTPFKKFKIPPWINVMITIFGYLCPFLLKITVWSFFCLNNSNVIQNRQFQ
jgi:hypothetical protein